MRARASSFRSRNHRNKRIRHNLYKYGGIGLGVLSIFFSFFFLVRADFLKVKDAAIQGTEILSKASVKKITDEELDSKSLWFIPQNNFILFPRKLTEDKIKEQFATVADVSVSFEGLSKILVNVKEYKPAFLWCDSVAREKCYLMDDRGYIFNESAGFSQGALFTYYGIVNKDNPIGKTYLPEDKFKELSSFADSLKLLKLTPLGVNSLGGGDYEIYLSNSGKVIFSDREPFLTTFENLESVIAEQNKIDANFVTDLDYIDVRFNSKVFVKLKSVAQ